MRAAEQIDLFDVEEHVRRILLGRRIANSSGQRGEDVQNIRAAFLMKADDAHASDAPHPA